MKYRLRLDLKLEFLGTTLYRIERISDGLLGGYVEKESNLSQKGNAWINGNAQIYGNARIYDDARINGDAWITGNAQIFGDARINGDAWIHDDAIVDSKAAVIVLCVPKIFSVTVTRKLIFIGCKVYDRKTIKKMTPERAAKAGLPKEYFKSYKQMILGAMLLVEEKK
jgi:hypothetical protein